MRNKQALYFWHCQKQQKRRSGAGMAAVVTDSDLRQRQGVGIRQGGWREAGPLVMKQLNRASGYLVINPHFFSRVGLIPPE